jgi:predicted GTPase
MTQRSLQDELENLAESMRAPSIVLLGRSGAGKSSIINSVFGSEMAKVGTGLPVSTTFEKYGNDNVIIYDSRGYEAGDDDSDGFIKGVADFIAGKDKQSLEHQIHLVWYVIPANTKRVLPYDSQIICKIMEHRIPVCIVLSQADLAREAELKAMEETIRGLLNEFDGDQNLFFKYLRIAANPIHGDAYGVNDLVNYTVEMLPVIYKEGFIKRQISNMAVKRKLALEYIKKSAVGCFAVGYVPIPFSTPAAAMYSQKELVRNISEIYNYTELADALEKVSKINKASVAAFLGTSALDAISSLTFTFGGVLLTGSLAGIASATYIVVMGYTYISVFEQFAQKKFDGLSDVVLKDQLKEIFSAQFKRHQDIKISKKDDLDNLDTLFDQAT